MTILTKALSAIGLMRVSDHERIVADNDDHAYKAWSKMASERDRMSASRTELMHTIAEMQVKFNAAITDLAAAREDIEEIAYERDELRPDAQKWRDSLKRSRDRKEAKKNATPRDKRAKNRGGGK